MFSPKWNIYINLPPMAEGTSQQRDWKERKKEAEDGKEFYERRSSGAGMACTCEFIKAVSVSTDGGGTHNPTHTHYLKSYWQLMAAG